MLLIMPTTYIIYKLGSAQVLHRSLRKSMHSSTGWQMVASICWHEIDCKKVYSAASELSLQLL